MPRYTRMVGWLTRTATLFLTVLLAAGPAVASVCEAVCVAPSGTIASAGSEAIAQPHPQHAPAAHQHRPARHADTAHAHHQAVETTAAARDLHSSRLLGQDCCRQLARPRASLAASRIDTDVLPGSHAALHRAAAILSVADRQPLGPTHGPPPGDLSPVRVPLVLRI